MHCIWNCFIYKYEIHYLNTAFLLMSNLEEVITQTEDRFCWCSFQFSWELLYVKVPLFLTNSVHSAVGAFDVSENTICSIFPVLIWNIGLSWFLCCAPSTLTPLIVIMSSQLFFSFCSIQYTYIFTSSLHRIKGKWSQSRKCSVSQYHDFFTKLSTVINEWCVECYIAACHIMWCLVFYDLIIIIGKTCPFSNHNFR